jgi:hypothetical protein
MDENKGSTVMVVETQTALPSFLDDKLDLKKVARDISKASSKAVEVLLKLLESKDEKVRLTAATKLVEFQVQIAKEVSNDQLQRLVAEIKLVRGAGRTKNLVPLQDGGKRENTTPVIDFSRVLEIE